MYKRACAHTHTAHTHSRQKRRHEAAAAAEGSHHPHHQAQDPQFSPSFIGYIITYNSLHLKLL